MSKRFIYYNAPSNSPYTTAFVAACNADGVALTTTEIDALEALESELTAAGLINYSSPSSNILEALYPYVGGAAASHKYNFLDARDLDAAFRITWSGGVTHNSNGVTGNGVNGTGDTHYIPSIRASNLISVSTYNRTNGTDGGPEIIAADSTLLSYVDLFSKFTDNFTYYSVNTTGANFTTLANVNALVTTNNNSTNGQELYYRGANVGSGSGILGKPDRSIKLLGMAGFGYSSRNIALNHIGLEMDATQNSAFYTAVQNFQTALSRQV